MSKKTSQKPAARRSLHAVVRAPLPWIEVPTEKQEKILRSKMLVGAFLKKYSQPDWCNYPEALAGMMGCWSLTLPGKIRAFKDCKGCECRSGRRRSNI